MSMGITLTLIFALGLLAGLGVSGAGVFLLLTQENKILGAVVTGVGFLMALCPAALYVFILFNQM